MRNNLIIKWQFVGIVLFSTMMGTLAEIAFPSTEIKQVVGTGWLALIGFFIFWWATAKEAKEC